MLAFIAQLALGVNQIRVVFPEKQYRPMINHVANALENWEGSRRKRNVLKPIFYDEMQKVQTAIDSMREGIAFTPDMALAVSFLTGSSFLTKEFKFRDPLSGMVIQFVGVLLIEFNSKFWKEKSEHYVLVV